VDPIHDKQAAGGGEPIEPRITPLPILAPVMIPRPEGENIAGEIIAGRLSVNGTVSYDIRSWTGEVLAGSFDGEDVLPWAPDPSAERAEEPRDILGRLVYLDDATVRETIKYGNLNVVRAARKQKTLQIVGVIPLAGVKELTNESKVGPLLLTLYDYESGDVPIQGFTFAEVRLVQVKPDASRVDF
jgi:hypothetical protein